MAATSLNQERLQEICGSLREQLFRNGTTGLSGVARIFRQADFNGNKKLDREEFDEALSFCGLFLKSQDTSFLFKNFDRDGDGNINYNELLLGIQLPLSAPRLAMVERAFKKMDRDGSRVLDVKDLESVYDASKHPDVLEGKKTEAQVSVEFLKGFEGGKQRDGRVTFDEFKSYYQDLGASIPSDEYFVAMMQSVWKIRAASAAACEHDSMIKTYTGLLKQKVAQKTKTGQRLSLTLKGIFDFFDADESKAITKGEFSQALVRLGIPLNDKDLGIFFTYFAGSDGRISTAEFIGKMELDD